MTDIITLTLKSNNKELVLGDNTKFNIISIEGIDSSDMSLQMQNNAQFDGSFETGNRIGPRVITVEADYPSDEYVEDIRHFLEDFFIIHHSGTLTVNYMGIERSIEYRPTMFKDKRKTLLQPLSFMFELTCANPYFIGDTFSGNIADKNLTLYSPFNIWDSGISFSYRKYNNKLNVNNVGVVSTGLKIEFIATGNVSNPRVDNLTSNEFIRIIVDMVAGDKLVITTEQGHKRIELNGTNISQKKDRQSSYIQLDEGNNTLSYTADDGYNYLQVFLSWSAKYLGV